MLDAQSTTDKAPAADAACGFGPSEAALLLRNVAAARAIFRAVSLAAAAQFDGSIQYKDNKTGRWQPAVDAACSRLEAVRDVLMETRAAPSVDWFTPLSLAEAIASALWSETGRSQADGLDHLELESVAQVVIDSLDSMTTECGRTGVFDLASAAETTPVH